jgi:integrase
VLTIATTGLRRAEALALTIADLDVETSTITVSRTLAGVDDAGRPIFDETKTTNSERIVGVDDEVMAVLLDHLRQRPVAPSSGLIFTWEDGRPLRRDWVTRKFAEVAEATPGVRSDGRLHGLRHAFVTLAIGAGVPLGEVSKMAGHSGIQITTDLYGHVEDRHRRRATSKVAAVIRDAM